MDISLRPRHPSCTVNLDIIYKCGYSEWGIYALNYFDPTRLETRTKESSIGASIWKLKFFYTGNLDRVHRVIMIVSRAVFLPSKSMYTGTRKMVNYTCAGLSQEKFCWRLEAILTCKSFVGYKYRGERLIELFSSWFPPKFPSG